MLKYYTRRSSYRQSSAWNVQLESNAKLMRSPRRWFSRFICIRQTVLVWCGILMVKKLRIYKTICDVKNWTYPSLTIYNRRLGRRLVISRCLSLNTGTLYFKYELAKNKNKSFIQIRIFFFITLLAVYVGL